MQLIGNVCGFVEYCTSKELAEAQPLECTGVVQSRSNSTKYVHLKLEGISNYTRDDTLLSLLGSQ